MIRIYPVKIVLILSILFLGYSVFMVLLMGINSTYAFKIIGFTCIFVIGMCSMMIYSYRIDVSNIRITLIPNGFKGSKRFEIQLETIKRLEIREFKLWKIFDCSMYIIFFDIKGVEGAVIINQNMFFLKDIKELFNILEREYNIVYIKKKE